MIAINLPGYMRDESQDSFCGVEGFLWTTSIEGIPIPEGTKTEKGEGGEVSMNNDGTGASIKVCDK
jgi:hypothetical protein